MELADSVDEFQAKLDMANELVAKSRIASKALEDQHSEHQNLMASRINSLEMELN